MAAEGELKQTYDDYRRSPRKRRAWSADNPGNVAIRAELLAHLLELAGGQLRGTGRVLDVGCGGGWLLSALTAHGVEPQRLHGVDLLDARVAVARRRLPGADICVADARELPHPNGEFDLVTLLTCLSSLPDRDSVVRALAEANRVLASDGMLLCYEPRIPNPFNRATLHLSRSLLRSALGAERTSIQLTGFPPLARRLGPLTQRLYPHLSRLLSTHTLAAFQRR